MLDFHWDLHYLFSRLNDQFIYFCKEIMSVRYTYDQLIDSYFRSINNRMSKFSAEKCIEFVKKNKPNYNEEQFMKKLAIKLLELDDLIQDYDSTDLDDEEEEKSK